ncbi:MAG TPA: ribosome-associated translation inhibitor RaiA [Candidatus Luteococcus avicola]|uniref:Ribosome hibernation promoting factor n=1 Tax=Luteococcus sanguinis TaxID=174038 RepID=A0ABW1WYL8_9ACTN|nr:ribosome-associated translation inhibitor RaiA [Candidatus Luteococcus avicola]
MEIIVNGRHCTISDETRQQVSHRLQSVEKLRDRVIRTEVEFTNTEAKGDPSQTIRCEITMYSKGPVIRAVASAEDKMVAFDKAIEKLRNQLRKASDRRKHHRSNLRAPQVIQEIAPEPVDDGAPETRTLAGDVQMTGDGPLVVREKEFPLVPLSLAQALDEMELVGHDFFLYVDAETKAPSVAYRRKGYDYGVIHLR